MKGIARALLALFAGGLVLAVGCTHEASQPATSPRSGEAAAESPFGPPPPPKIIVDPNAPDPDPLMKEVMGAVRHRHWVLSQKNDTGKRKARKGGSWGTGSNLKMNSYYMGEIVEFKGLDGGTFEDIDWMQVEVKGGGKTRLIIAERIKKGGSSHVKWVFDGKEAVAYTPPEGQEEELPAEFDGTSIKIMVKWKDEKVAKPADEAYILMDRL